MSALPKGKLLLNIVARAALALVACFLFVSPSFADSSSHPHANGVVLFEAGADYIKRVAPYAQAEQSDSGVPASFSIAQSAFESQWGASSLAATYNNYHGIQCSGPSEGLDCVSLRASDGTMKQWNRYSTPANGFLWHGRWLKAQGNYNEAFKHTDDTLTFARGVLQCYTGCSAPFPQSYYDFLVTTIDGYNLRQYDVSSAPVPAQRCIPLANSPSPSSAPLSFGIAAYLSNRTKFDLSEINPAVQQISDAHASWVREDLTWELVGGRDGPFDWDRVKQAVQAERGRGLNIVGLLGYPPSGGWVGPNQPFPSPPSDEMVTRWRAYLRSAIQTFRNDIHYWEIWNEPNLEQFWRAKANPGDYAVLLRAACETIRGEDPQAHIILGGMSRVHAQDTSDDLTGQAWLEQLYQLGAGDTFEIVAVHPYNATPENVAQDVRDLAQVITHHPEAGAKPVWLTEVGWKLDEPAVAGRSQQRCAAYQPCASQEQIQAEYLVRTYVLAHSIPGVERVFWHALKDGSDGRYGLISSGSPRASFTAFALVGRLLEGATFDRQVGGPGIDSGNGLGDDVYEFRFTHGAETIAVLWKGGGGDQPRAVAVRDLSGPQVQVFKMDGSQATIPVNNSTITIQLTETPQLVIIGPADWWSSFQAAIGEWFKGIGTSIGNQLGDWWRQAQTGIQKQLDDWWRQAQPAIQKQIDEWIVQAQRELEQQLQRQLQQLVNQLCGTTGGVLLVPAILLVLVNKRRRHRG